MLSGPLGGSLSSRRPFIRIQIWTSTLTSQVTKRLRNLSLRIILKNPVLLLRPIPLLHRLFLLLTPEFLCSFSVCLMSTFIFFFHVYPFSFVGPGAWDLCNPHFNKYSFFKDLCSHWSVFTFLHEPYSPN